MSWWTMTWSKLLGLYLSTHNIFASAPSTLSRERERERAGKIVLEGAKVAGKVRGPCTVAPGHVARIWHCRFCFLFFFKYNTFVTSM
jgi:hypothetical protein